MKIKTGKKGKLDNYLALARLVLWITDVAWTSYVCAALCAVHAVYLFWRGIRPKDEKPIESYMFLIPVAVIISEGIVWMLGGRAGMAIAMLMFAFAALCALLAKDRECRSACFYEALVFGSYVYVDARYITVLSMDTFSVGAVGAVLGLAMSVIACLRIAKGVEENKAAVCLIATVILTLACAFCSVTVLKSSNYAFDTSDGTKCELYVSDKDHTRFRKRPDDYVLTVVLQGKAVDMNVSYRDYDSVEIGDAVNVYLYTGAFGYAYLLPNVSDR